MTAEIDVGVGHAPVGDDVAQASLGGGTEQTDFDPIAVICDDHALQLELCNILEFIADGLPDVSNQRLIDIAISILQHAWPTHVALEEQHLFPMLRSRLADSAMTLDILDQLEHEHAADEDVAREVVFALESLQSTSGQFDAAAAGYLLRSFFESQRRHITWENSTVLPLARSVLSAEDLAAMRAAIAASDGPVRVREVFASLRSVSLGCQGCGDPTCCGNGND